MDSTRLLFEELKSTFSANIVQDSACKSIETSYQLSDLVALIRQSQSTEHELLQLLSILKRFLSICNAGWLLETSEFVDFVNVLREVGGVPNFKDRKDCGFDSSDFVNAAERAALVMPIIECLVAKFSIYWQNQTIKFGNVWRNLLTVAVLLSAEHARENLWSSKASRLCSTALQQTLVTCSRKENFSQLLNDQFNNESVFQAVLIELKLKLTKSLWKNNPAAICAFQYLLFNIRSPALSQYLGDVLPPSLLMVDDFQLEHRLAGIACLEHIIANVSSTELLWFGRAEVIFCALQHLTYTREAELISAVHPCLRLILQVIIKDTLKLDEAGEESKWDAVLSQLLRDMEFEDKLVVRRAFATQLQPYIKLLGLGILKHMQRLLRVLTSYLEIDDGLGEVTRLCVTDAFHELIIQASPRMHVHCLRLSQSFVRCLYDLSSNVDSVEQLSVAKQQLAKRCMECMTLLSKYCFSEMTSIIDELTRVANEVRMNKRLIEWLTQLHSTISTS